MISYYYDVFIIIIIIIITLLETINASFIILQISSMSNIKFTAY